jgi:small-conductance mechanosensitive channel
MRSPPAAALLHGRIAVVLVSLLVSAAATAADPAPPPPPVTLYDIVGELARTDSLKRDIAATLRDTSDVTALTATPDARVLAPEFRALVERTDAVTRVRYLELLALDVHIRQRAHDLNASTAALGRLTQKLVADLDRLDREAAAWPERAKLARARESPAEVQRGIEAVGPELAALRAPLLERRDQFLVAYDRAVRNQSQLEALLARVVERREAIRAGLRADAGSPIWKREAVGFPLEELQANVRLVHEALVEYLRQHGERTGVLFVVLSTLMFVFLRRPATAVTQRAAMPSLSAGTAACGALVVALPCVAAFAPPAPFAFYRLVWFFFPLLAALVATRTFAKAIPATAWTLGFAVFLNEFRALAEMSPAADWLLLVVQVAPFGAALVHDQRRGALAAFLQRWPRVLLDRFVHAVIVLLVIAAIASLLGYASIANGLVVLTVMAPGYMLTFAAVAWVLDRAFAGLFATPLAHSFRSVREQRDTVLRTLHWVAVLLAWAAGILTFTVSYSALDDLIHFGAFITSTRVSAGDVTITLTAVLSALGVVAITWVATKLVRFVLDHEVLPRLDLRTGVPIAISTIVGYVLVVTGAVLAMAALGIDLTKVTLLAGALGIGVGLGLQNVVSNFASGLILMLERPINVGDQVDVGGVLGEVKRIGVRSSTIRTFQGAEVIVPNTDLASKQVTNWTLSDRARRYEIDVSVAYGSDPERVLRLLESAAADVPEVQAEPVPRALFTGFGDSSLDFRLFAWVESIDVGLQAQNSLRMAVLRKLGEAGIEIPFPQRDLHIRYAPGDPAAEMQRPRPA